MVARARVGGSAGGGDSQHGATLIPRVAYFYWTGGPLPWLRAQALATFQRHHPDWRVCLGSPERRELPGVEWIPDDVTDPRLPPAARSDWWRWHVLGKLGGFYADTDVLFLRNVGPLFSGDFDAWLTVDGGTEYPGAPYVYQGPALGKRPAGGVSIGVAAAQPGSQFFLRATAWCRWTEDRDYQALGTRLLVAHWNEFLSGVRMGPIPHRAFYRGSSAAQVRALWSDEPSGVAPHEYGVHWYGGSTESAAYSSVTRAEDLPRCRVRGALLS